MLDCQVLYPLKPSPGPESVHLEECTHLSGPLRVQHPGSTHVGVRRDFLSLLNDVTDLRRRCAVLLD